MTRRGIACLGVAAIGTLLAAACGYQPITSQSPVYVLVDDGGNLAVDVLNQAGYGIAGKIQIVSVGAMPPNGAVAAQPGGKVLVTYSGVDNGQQLQLKPNTVACSLASSQCNTIWSGFGSSTADTLADSSIAVPGWDDVHFTSGRLAIFGGQSLGLQRQVPLANSVPGPVAVSPDGRFAYWLTYVPASGDQAPERELLRIDTSSGRGASASTVRFGKRLPFDVVVASDGQVLVSILYDEAPVRPTEPGATAGPGVLGSSVILFSPDLATSHALTVQAGPSFIASGASALLVASTTATLPVVRVYDRTTGHLRNEPPIPQGWSVAGITMIRLDTGEEAGVIELNRSSHDHFRLGIVSLSTGDVVWHQFSGELVGDAAA